VKKLLKLNTDQLKKHILQTLDASDQRSMMRETALKKIATKRGASQLRGPSRDEFRGNLNRAIGALVRMKPPQVVISGAQQDRIALPTKKRAAPASRPTLMRRVEKSINSFTFTCEKCGEEVSATSTDDELTCDCGQVL